MSGEVREDTETDWFARSGVGLWRFSVLVWCVSYDPRSGVRKGCGWLASLKMKMVWERDVASCGCGWRWINLISLHICEWKSEFWGTEGWGSGLEARRRTARVWKARVKNKNAFFFFIYSTPLTELVRFGWGFSGFRFLKPNRTKKNFKNFNRFFFTVRFF